MRFTYISMCKGGCIHVYNRQRIIIINSYHRSLPQLFFILSSTTSLLFISSPRLFLLHPSHLTLIFLPGTLLFIHDSSLISFFLIISFKIPSLPGTGISPVPCPIGTYNNILGIKSSYECHVCDAGSYCSTSGLPGPNGLCTPGFYCPEGTSVHTCALYVCIRI